MSSSCRTVELFLIDLAAKPNCLALEWTVPRMADECGLGATQFIRHCKQITNTTPLQHLNNCRLELARRILAAQPERSVTQIAMDYGFSSGQYFATVFRQQFTCSPREFRARNSESLP